MYLVFGSYLVICSVSKKITPVRLKGTCRVWKRSKQSKTGKKIP